MEKKTVIGVVVAVIAFSGVWYLFTNSISWNGEPSTTATTTEEVATTTAPAPAAKTSATKPASGSTVVKPAQAPAKTTGIGPLSYLFSLKQPLVCTIQTMAGYKRSGTMYVAGKQMRANLTTSTMINDGEYVYVWMNGATKGLKLSASSGAAGSAIASNGGFDLSTDLSYSCSSWVENAALFVPPASVSFSNTL